MLRLRGKSYPDRRLSMERTMSRFRTSVSVLGLAAAAFASPAYAASLTVPVDEVRVITFATPVKTVFVGNPSVADINVIDPRHVFLLGKAFGTTNLLALDASGKQVADEKVTVLAHQDATVTLQRGTARTTLNCMAQRCEVSPMPGDDAASYDAVTGQVDKHEQQNLKSAGAGR
jgi:Flp pilus assembly secretin CpaC